LEIGLKDNSDSLLNSIRQIKDVAVETMNTDYSEWTIRFPRGKGLSATIQKCLANHRESIWNVFSVYSVSPDFESKPEITSLSPHEAAFLLLEGLRQGFSVEGTMDRGQNRPGEWLWDLSVLLEGIPCFSLSVGDIRQMQNLIETVWKKIA